LPSADDAEAGAHLEAVVTLPLLQLVLDRHKGQEECTQNPLLCCIIGGCALEGETDLTDLEESDGAGSDGDADGDADNNMRSGYSYLR